MVVDTTRPNAFFGLYQLHRLDAQELEMLGRAINWAIGYQNPATAKVWLASYNGQMVPERLMTWLSRCAIRC